MGFFIFKNFTVICNNVIFFFATKALRHKVSQRQSNLSVRSGKNRSNNLSNTQRPLQETLLRNPAVKKIREFVANQNFPEGESPPKSSPPPLQ